MDWSDVGEMVVKSAPVLGGVLAGPAGAKIGAVVASIFGSEADPDSVAAAIKADPEAAVKLQAIEKDRQIGLARINSAVIVAEINASMKGQVAINETMQAEGRSEHWPQYWWRPLIGMSYALQLTLLGLTVMSTYMVVIFKKLDPTYLAHLPNMITAMIGILGAAAAVLGVAAHHRGKQKRIAQGERVEK